jgi:hypothetical protein
VPEFAEMALPNEKFYFGLEGDPMFPYRGEREEWTLDKKVPIAEGGYMMHFRNGDDTKVVSSNSVGNTEVFEYTEECMNNKIANEMRTHEYRGETGNRELVSEFQSFKDNTERAILLLTKEVADLKQAYRGTAYRSTASLGSNIAENVDMFSDNESCDSDY